MIKVASILAVAVAGLVLVAAAEASARRPMTKTAYVTQLKTIGKHATTSIAKLDAVKTATGAASLLATMQTNLKADARKLGALRPPLKVVAINRQLVRALDELVVELNPIITKFRAHEPGQAIASLSTLKGLRDLETSGAALSRAGYGIHLALGG